MKTNQAVSIINGSQTATIYSISSWNGPCSQSFTQPSNETGYAFILNKMTAGGSVASIIPTITNWRRQMNTLTLTDGTPFVINSFVVIVNGVAVPATRGGLGAPFSVGAGDNDFQFDPIPASAFGYGPTGIPTRTRVSFKQVRTLNSGTDSIQAQFQYLTNADPGQQSLTFNPANTTITNPNTAGSFTTTGAAPVSRAVINFDTWMLGTFVNGPTKVFIANGNSETMGVGNNTFTIDGGGWFNRAMVTNDFACINMAIGSETAVIPFTDPRLSSFYKYANRGIIFYGPNDFGPSGTLITASTLISQMQACKANMMSAQGSRVLKVAACKTLRRTSSTDSWATETNQTYVAPWGPGGNVDNYNTLLDSAGFDLINTFTVAYGAVDSFKWPAPPASTGDGLHPNNNTHVAMAAQVYASLAIL